MPNDDDDNDFALDYPKNGKDSSYQMLVIYQYTRRHIADGVELNQLRPIILITRKLVLVGSKFLTAMILKILSSGM